MSDGVDGFLARRYNWRSRLGMRLDPLADKALMLATYLTLGWQGLLPHWLVGLVVIRDVVILGGALTYRSGSLATDLKPSLISKLNTVVQMMLALAAICFEAVGMKWVLLLEGLVIAVATTTVASGLWYLVRWGMTGREG